MRRNDMKYTQIHNMITTAWGNIISLRRVQTIAKEYEDGTRQQLMRKEGSGRRKSDERINTAELIQNDIEDNGGKITVRELAEKHGLSKDTTHRIIKDIGFVSKSLKWVPHLLTDDNKRNRIDCCEEMVRVFNETRNIKKFLVVTDEKWFYSRPLGNSKTRLSWIQPDGHRPQCPKRIISDKKFLVLMCSNFDGLSYYKILDQGITVNSTIYCEFLTEAFTNFNTYENIQARNAIPVENAILFHDNARPHVSHQTTDFLRTKNIKSLKQPAYSPDVNLCDRMIFPLLEMRRSKVTFNTKNDLDDFLQDNMATLTKDIMHHQFEMLHKKCIDIIENNGNYC